MKLTFSTIITVAVGFTACEAFAPRHLQLAASSQCLSSRNAFFGFGVDEKTTTANAASPNSKALIERAKDIIKNKSGFYSNFDADVFSEEFVFRGPYIGPLNKKDYLDTMDAFSIYKALPDIDPNAWGFSIDPKDPNRVWFMVRNTGTFDGEPFFICHRQLQAQRCEAGRMSGNLQYPLRRGAKDEIFIGWICRRSF